MVVTVRMRIDLTVTNHIRPNFIFIFNSLNAKWQGHEMPLPLLLSKNKLTSFFFALRYPPQKKTRIEKIISLTFGVFSKQTIVCILRP